MITVKTKEQGLLKRHVKYAQDLMQGKLPVMEEEKDDGALMQLVAAGDQRAFQQLMRRHLPKTVRLAARMLGSELQAEDVAQDAFVSVWKHAADFKDPKASGAKFTTWLYRIVLNRVIDEKRKHKFTPIDSIAEPKDDRDNAEEAMQKDDKMSAFRKALKSLPKSQHAAIVLCFYEECSNKQAAEALGVSVKALESLLVRARRSLKLELKDFAKEVKGQEESGI